MLLSDKRIVEEMECGNIVIEPFDERHLGTNSYDCRLGEWYFAQEEEGMDLHLFGEDMRASWGIRKRASKGEIPVRPGETILAHTMEVIGGRNGYLVCLRTRSTVKRSGGLDVCGSAGLGDSGYIAKWTLEIHNQSKNTIWLPVGGRICQFECYYIGETLKHYAGNYGQEEEWTPECMLPSAKMDWAVLEYRETQRRKDKDECTIL